MPKAEKQNTNYLFELIKSLNKPEKGYFRKYFCKDDGVGKNNYVVLFDLLDGFEEYDEEKINKTIHKKLTGANLPSLKNYLYEQILKSLRAYHAGDSIASELREILSNVEVLFAKKLFQQALSLNQKGKQKAINLDLPHQTILFLMMERNLLSLMHTFPAKRETVFNDILSEIINLENSTKLFHLDSQITDISNQFYPPRDETLMQDIINMHKLLQPFENKNLPPRSQLLFNSIAATYFYFIQEPVKALTLRKANLSVYDANPDIKSSNQKNYVTALINFIAVAHAVDDLPAAQKGITLLEKVKASSVTEAHNYQEILFSFKLFTLTHTTNKEAALNLIKQADAFFESVPSSSPHRNISLFRICLYYFNENDLEIAAERIHLLLQRGFTDWQQRIPTHARFLQIIIHYELDNTFLLDSLIRSCYRFLKKKELLYEPERIMLNFFKRLVTKHKSETIPLFKKLRNDLEESAKNRFNNNFFNEYNYINWLDKKIQVLSPVAKSV
ncbi:MAG: hypothetical protein H7Y00_03160 [Fimbriimonadaceae bacterium]|nr:hypothetical protein [Chitinophagales bacterium]